MEGTPMDTKIEQLPYGGLNETSFLLSDFGISRLLYDDISLDVEDDYLGPRRNQSGCFYGYFTRTWKMLAQDFAQCIWRELCPDELCKKLYAAGNKMTLETSRFDTEIGSYTVHVPKYCSLDVEDDYLGPRRNQSGSFYGYFTRAWEMSGQDIWSQRELRPDEWCKKISAAGNKMTLETSPNGGFDIELGSYTVHVPKYCSVHHPLIQMVLFAYTLYDSTLRCLNLVVPQSIVKFNKSCLLTKPRSHLPNTISARKGVHVLAHTAPKNHSIAPGLDKNIPKFGGLDYNVDLSTVPVHSGGSALENVYNLHSLTSAPSSTVHGITEAEEKTKDWRLANIAKAEDKIVDCRLANIAKEEDNSDVTWLMATAAVHHATGIRDILSGFTTIKDLFVKAADGGSMPVCGRGSVTTGTVVLQDVWFVPGLTENLVSVTQLTELDYSVGFSRAACIIKSAADDAVIGKAHVSEDGLFELDFLKAGPVI